MAGAGGRRTWMVPLAWTGAVLATVLNGVVVGYGAVWFQLFGDSADAEDYAVSAGGYGAAAGVLAFAVVAILTHGGPRWLVWPTGTCAVVLGLLAGRSGADAASADGHPADVNTAWDGIGGVLWAPWAWMLVALALHGLWLRLRPGRGARAPRR